MTIITEREILIERHARQRGKRERIILASLLACALIGNVIQLMAYQKQSLAYAQEEGLRDQADELLRTSLPDQLVYQLRVTREGELGVYCLNDGDATVRPSSQFGHITVSCGK